MTPRGTSGGKRQTKLSRETIPKGEVDWVKATVETSSEGTQAIGRKLVRTDVPTGEGEAGTSYARLFHEQSLEEANDVGQPAPKEEKRLETQMPTGCRKVSYGLLCFAEIHKLGPLPPLEIAHIDFFEDAPSNFTYPTTHPYLLFKVREKLGL